MKTKTLILIAILAFVWTNGGSLLQSQEPLPDTVWTKKNLGGMVNVVKFSPDGQYLFVGADYDILQFDVKTGELIRTLSFHRAYVTKIGFSPTGDTIISSGWDGRIVLWDYQTGDTIAYISTLRDMNKAIDSDALITPDGKRIITLTGLVGLDKPQIIVFDIETKEIIKTFTGIFSQANNLAVSNDGKYFSFWDFRSTKGILFLMDLNTYEEIAMIEYPDAGLFDNIISWDSKILAAVTTGHGIFLWDIEKLKLIKNFRFNNNLNLSYGIRRVSFSRDSKNIIFGCYDYEDYEPSEVIVWNIEKDTLVYKYPFSAVESIDISKNDYIASVGNSAYKLWHVNLLRPNWKITDVKENITNNLKYTFNNSKLKIFFDEEMFAKPEINIYNILGVGANGRSPVQHDFSPVQNGNEIEINLEYLTSGVYFVVVDVGGKRNVVKILK